MKATTSNGKNMTGSRVVIAKPVNIPANKQYLYLPLLYINNVGKRAKTTNAIAMESFKLKNPWENNLG